MQPKLQHNFTNWTDGMKINRQHFIDSENALLDLLRDLSASNMNSCSYGLLDPLPGEKTSLECNVISAQPSNFKISVSYCRAVTAGGCRIEIIPGLHPELVSDNGIFSEGAGYDGRRSNASTYFAIISVDPFNRQPFGAGAPDEFPPRHPFSTSNYKLSLIPEDQLNTSSLGAFHLPVARFGVRNGELVRDSNYIPPCAVVSAHTGTKQVYNNVAELLNKIQELSKEIIKKAVNLSQNAPLAQNIRKICEAGVQHISSEFFLFRTLYRQQSPVHIANSVIQVANCISVSLAFMADKEKEEVLQYFSNWNNITPGKFEELLATVNDTEYEHENIFDTFQPLLEFLRVWCELLEKINKLELIGQKNSDWNFGERTHVTAPSKEKSKFKFN